MVKKSERKKYWMCCKRPGILWHQKKFKEHWAYGEVLFDTQPMLMKADGSQEVHPYFRLAEPHEIPEKGVHYG